MYRLAGKTPARKEDDLKLTNAVWAACCAALLSGFLTLPLEAQPWNRKTVVTFSAPVEIPAVHLKGWGVLPAGTYVFKLMDSLSNRHIVQIFSQDEKTLYATILAIPNSRLKATDKTVMTFRERAAGEPEALRAWFYPGRLSGDEFVYPKSKAVGLAKATSAPVLYTVKEIPVEVTQPSQLSEQRLLRDLREAPVQAVEPSGRDVELAAVVTPPPAEELADSPEPAQVASAQEPAPRLPETASPLMMLGMLGFFALGGALFLRIAQRRLN
jgi:hypothetical protein